MRAGMIVLGSALITKFAWLIYIFGAFLILTGLKMIFKKEEDIHPERNPVVRWFILGLRWLYILPSPG